MDQWIERILLVIIGLLLGAGGMKLLQQDTSQNVDIFSEGKAERVFLIGSSDHKPRQVDDCLSKSYDMIGDERAGCALLGSLYFYGNDEYPKDEKKARLVLQAACECKTNNAETAFAIAYYKALEEQNQMKYAPDILRSIKSACKRGDIGVCNWLADRNLSYN